MLAVEAPHGRLNNFHRRYDDAPGPEAGGAAIAFYVEAPDIPEGMTCADWRRLRRPPPEPRLAVPFERGSAGSG